MADSKPQGPSIAIVGGGIAGLYAVLAILRHAPHINLTLYESAHHFTEIGGGVAIGPNSSRAMDLIGSDVKEGFNKIKTTNMWDSKQNTWFEFRWGMDMEYDEGEQGKKMSKTGELIEKVECPKGQATVHRARLLDEMVKLVPDGIAKFGKRVVGIAEVHNGTKVKLTFKDGEEVIHDGVVGCDGIKSRIREFVAPGCTPSFSAKYCHRGVVPMSKAIDAVGEEFAMNNTVYIGLHGHVNTYPIDHGEKMSLVLFSGQPTWDSPDWIVPSTKAHMHRDFANWGPAIHNLISLMEKTDIWSIHDHLDRPAQTYAHNNVLIMGDAAHASTPFQGSGAGMAIEDAYVLGMLLSKALAPRDLGKAFKAFDEVRRERTQKLVRTSREAGRFWEFEEEAFGRDVGGMRENMRERMRWVWEEDLVGEVERGWGFMGV